MLCLSTFELYSRWVPLNHLCECLRENAKHERSLRLRASGGNNSQHCCANNVGSCCVRVGSGVQTDARLPTVLGPAVHHGKDTTHKSL